MHDFDFISGVWSRLSLAVLATSTFAASADASLVGAITPLTPQTIVAMSAAEANVNVPQSIPFAKFDPAMGSLLSIDIEIDGRFNLTVVSTGNGGTAAGYASGSAKVNGVEISYPVGGNHAEPTGPETNYRGFGAYTYTQLTSADAAFASFVGAGPGEVGSIEWALNGATFLTGNVEAQLDLLDGSKVTVTYNFTSVPEPTAVLLLPALLFAARRDRRCGRRNPIRIFE